MDERQPLAVTPNRPSSRSTAIVAPNDTISSVGILIDGPLKIGVRSAATRCVGSGPGAVRALAGSQPTYPSLASCPQAQPSSLVS